MTPLKEQKKGKKRKNGLLRKKNNAAAARGSRFLKDDQVFSKEERSQIEEMAKKCEESMKTHRSIGWTEYARRPGNYPERNFGNGREPAPKCLGCHRFLPIILLTGDHIVPQSNHQALRQKIAYELDGFDRNIYEKVVKMRVASLLKDPIVQHIQRIKQYDDTLKDDLRNIQPLCWYCNATKGNRQNVNLYPKNARVPRRSHESPR